MSREVVPGAIRWSNRLVITLKRGLPGKREDHKKIVKALGFQKKRESTVERVNSPTIRGMIQKVKYLLQVETKEMRDEKLVAEAARTALRPPLKVFHRPTRP
eukprot:TRINITY_DN27086_c0_g1_i1.p2 TRINITY_DN27086_c0_g1~~TRINITY_DN27086_c0_g1_i1.p2  ORF type:complete len:102 (+),score=18.97 TRINITY_DN27086_c0_g1_i1:825-1130(+)